jgi:hypothetical protein
MEAIAAALLLVIIQFILIPTLLLAATPYVLAKACFGSGPYLANVQDGVRAALQATAPSFPGISQP